MLMNLCADFHFWPWYLSWQGMRIGYGILHHTNSLNFFQKMQKCPQGSGNGDLRWLPRVMLTSWAAEHCSNSINGFQKDAEISQMFERWKLKNVHPGIDLMDSNTTCSAADGYATSNESNLPIFFNQTRPLRVAICLPISLLDLGDDQQWSNSERRCQQWSNHGHWERGIPQSLR